MTMPDHLDDESVSAFLDDAVDAAETAAVTAHISQCGVCRDRLDEFTRVKSLVGAPPPPLEPTAVDRLIAGALAASGRSPAPAPVRVGGDPSPAAEPDGAPGAVPIPITTRSPRRVPAWLAAAAAVAALVVGVPALLRATSQPGSEQAQITNTSDDESAAFSADKDSGTEMRSAAPETLEAAPAQSGGAVASGSAGDAATTGVETQAGAGFLGAFETDEELVRRLISELATSSAAPPAGAPCVEAAQAVGGSRVGSLLHVAYATWRGTAAVVVTYSLTEPVEGASRQAYVMVTEGCALLAEPRF